MVLDFGLWPAMEVWNLVECNKRCQETVTTLRVQQRKF